MPTREALLYRYQSSKQRQILHTMLPPHYQQRVISGLLVQQLHPHHVVVRCQCLVQHQLVREYPEDYPHQQMKHCPANPNATNQESVRKLISSK